MRSARFRAVASSWALVVGLGTGIACGAPRDTAGIAPTEPPAARIDGARSEFDVLGRVASDAVRATALADEVGVLVAKAAPADPKKPAAAPADPKKAAPADPKKPVAAPADTKKPAPADPKKPAPADPKKPAPPAEPPKGNDPNNPNAPQEPAAKTPDPEEFGEGYKTSLYMIGGVTRLQDSIRDAKTAAEKKKAKDELDAHLKETGRFLRVTLGLVDSKSKPEEINSLRYSLAFVDFQLGRSYDAAVVGRFLARVLAEDDPETAQNARMLVVYAWNQAFQAAKEKDRPFLLDRLTEAVEDALQHDKKGESSNQARLILAGAAAAGGRAAKAAELFSKIPEAAPEYAESQMSAGRAFWSAYLTESAAAKPRPQELANLLKLSETHLKAGVTKSQKSLQPGELAPVTLLFSKLTLAQILTNGGKYEEALGLLTKPPAAVADAVKVSEGETRPATGLKSIKTALSVWQLRLRAYVGLRRLDEAQDALRQLEALGGGAGLAAIYLALGKELQEEIGRLRAAGDDKRLDEVRKSFEALLEGIHEQRQNQSYGTLRWVAETYTALGEGDAADSQVAAGYFDKAAAAYGVILERSEKDAKFMDPARRDSVALLLAGAHRRAGRTDAALERVSSILKRRPSAVDAQVEAALVYEAQAERARTDAGKLFLQAINGTTTGTPPLKIWGWYDLARKLQETLEKGSTSATFRDTYWLARFHASDCHRRFALAQTDKTKKATELERARRSVALLIGGSEIPITDEWFDRFDGLFQQIQKDLGQAPQKLARREE